MGGTAIPPSALGQAGLLRLAGRTHPLAPHGTPAVAMTLLRWLVFLTGLDPTAPSTWGVSYPEALRGIAGSCVVFPCTLSFPDDVSAAAGIVAIWYKDYEGQKTMVFHSGDREVDANFRGRTQLLGDPTARNCTLLLRGARPEDSGLYRFRFEVVDGDRWSAARDVALRVEDTLERPSISASEEVSEDTLVTMECSSPYACPLSAMTLRWAGYNPRVSALSSHVQVDTRGVSRRQSLTTSFSWRDHSRTLLCEVLLGSQRASTELVLRVRHAPKGTKVSLDPPTQHVRVGDTLSLSCAVNSSHPPVTAFRWYKDGAAAGTGSILVLRGVRGQDHGRYHCEAQNAVGTGVAPAVMLYVMSAEVSISPAAEVQEGTATTLSCDVPGQEGRELNYTWYRNGAWLQQGPSHRLLLPHAAASDAGFYSCTATEAWGSAASPALSLSVTYPPRTPVLTLLQEPQGGGMAVVSCVVDSRPPATLALYHGDALVASSSSPAAPGQRLGVTAARNALRLELRGVRPQDSGTYRCTATNALGNATATRPFVARPTQVQVHPSSEVREGAAVTLRCVTPGDAPGSTTYTWYRNGRQLVGHADPVLSFPSVRSGDAGAFQCQARGGRDGDGDTSGAVPLRVLFPPRQPVLSSFLQTQGGQLGVIQCTVESEPEAELSLWRGDEAVACTRGCPLAPSPRRRITASYNSLRLELQDVVLEDEGTYVCRAGNSQGNASAASQNRVMCWVWVGRDLKGHRTLERWVGRVLCLPPAARVVVSPSPRVLEGHAANLTCWVSTDSGTHPNVTWYRNGQQLPAGPTAALLLPQVTSGDAGLYHCTAVSGSSSRSSAAVQLDVLYPPRNPRLTAFLETQRGRLAIFQASVASNPPAQLALHRGEQLVASSSGGGHSPIPRVSAVAAPNALRVEVRDVTLGDEGSYRLTATNALGTVAQHLFFHVQAARVLVTPSSEVLEGDDVSLTCEVPGEPAPGTVFSWYKDGAPVHEGTDGVMELPHVASAAAGSYHCKAHGPTGTNASVSPAVTLRVLYPPRAPVLSSLLEAPGGRGAVLQCHVDSRPPALLQIHKDGVLVASSTPSPSATAPRLSVTAATNSLRVGIGGVLLEDEGEYVCSASNAYGNASTTANLTAGTARLWISPSPDVLEGDAVNLTCAVHSGARDALSYTWYKDGVLLSAGPNPTITIRSATAAVAGSYHCAVHGPAGTRSTAPSALRVRYPPRNLQLKSFTESGGGTALILLCTADSSPPAELSLHRDGERVDPSAAAGPRVPNTLRLELPAAAARDEGEYECRAHSPLGSARTSVHVRVQALRVRVLPAAEVLEGTAVTLSCEDAAPESGTTYAWLKNGRWLREGPSAALLLPTARSSDAGTYSCVARVGTRTQRAPPAELRVLYAPRQPSLVVLAELGGGWHSELLCTVDSQPPADVVLLHGPVPLASTRDPPAQAAPNALRVRVEGPGAAGLYVCVANNSFGAVNTSLLLGASGVRVTAEPSPEVPEGATVTMNCSAGTWLGAEANYSWYKDHRWLREGPRGSIVLSPVSSADTGFYHCRVSGTWGSASSAPLSLSVLHAPRDVSVSTFLENHHGRAGVVLCTASSHPPASLALFRRGLLLASSLAPPSSPGLHATAYPNALRLELGALGPGDAAEYRCTASNALGNATASAYFDTHSEWGALWGGGGRNIPCQGRG
ncbi:sialoadhesin [Numida meleagris]|uniref:sialoadhesin n=1 Tax=Numida meleagris TaxID=8996 RepID=UPI000B3E04FD|nr:sialoadhesin [Numida meleagris]